MDSKFCKFFILLERYRAVIHNFLCWYYAHLLLFFSQKFRICVTMVASAPPQSVRCLLWCPISSLLWSCAWRWPGRQRWRILSGSSTLSPSPLFQWCNQDFFLEKVTVFFLRLLEFHWLSFFFPLSFSACLGGGWGGGTGHVPKGQKSSFLVELQALFTVLEI